MDLYANQYVFPGPDYADPMGTNDFNIPVQSPTVNHEPVICQVQLPRGRKYRKGRELHLFTRRDELAPYIKDPVQLKTYIDEEWRTFTRRQREEWRVRADERTRTHDADSSMTALTMEPLVDAVTWVYGEMPLALSDTLDGQPIMHPGPSYWNAGFNDRVCLHPLYQRDSYLHELFTGSYDH